MKNDSVESHRRKQVTAHSPAQSLELVVNKRYVQYSDIEESRGGGPGGRDAGV